MGNLENGKTRKWRQKVIRKKSNSWGGKKSQKNGKAKNS